MEHPVLPCLEDLRFHIEDLLRETGLTNKALAAACNASTQSHQVTEDTIRRIRKEPRGHNVRYSVVAHMYNVLLAQAQPVSPNQPVSDLMITRFRFIRPTDNAREVAAFMGAQQFTVAPYEYQSGGKRRWDKLIGLDQLSKALETNEDPSIGDIIDSIKAPGLANATTKTTIHEFIGTTPRNWELCLVMDRPRNVAGLFTPWDLQRVSQKPLAQDSLA